jgi:hypothetical protein
VCHKAGEYDLRTSKLFQGGIELGLREGIGQRFVQHGFIPDRLHGFDDRAARGRKIETARPDAPCAARAPPCARLARAPSSRARAASAGPRQVGPACRRDIRFAHR